MNKTALDKRSDLSRAMNTLDLYRIEFSAGGLLLIQLERGSGVTDYLRVFLAYKRGPVIESHNITWTVATALGYSLRDRGGQWNIALGGGGYSKPLDVANALQAYYGLEKINWQQL